MDSARLLTAFLDVPKAVMTANSLYDGIEAYAQNIVDTVREPLLIYGRDAARSISQSRFLSDIPCLIAGDGGEAHL